MGAIEKYRGILRRSIECRPLVLTGGAVRAPLVAAARSLGSPKVLAIHEQAHLVAADEWATFGGDNWREAVEVFDPLHEALALGNNWQRSPELAGRRFVGRRRSEWAVFEDKTVVGQLWGWAGLTCAPSAVVDASKEALCRASQSLDQGQGTVWSGDHRDGEHYGGRHVRWVRNNEQMAAAAAYFGARCGPGSCRSWRASPAPFTASWTTSVSGPPPRRHGHRPGRRRRSFHVPGQQHVVGPGKAIATGDPFGRCGRRRRARVPGRLPGRSASTAS